MQPERLFLSGNEAIALAASRAGVSLGTGYPGTPSTEILEHLDRLGGRAQWAPNEKVALEVALGVAFTGARALCTMKHVGLNVASDVLFTAVETDVPGALVVVSADDPGMHSSQNEQDNRYYAVAAGVPMLEPADPQEAYEFTLAAIALAERWRMPVLLRVTTRVCHSKGVVVVDGSGVVAPAAPDYERRPTERVMIPGHARPAYRRQVAKLAEIQEFGESSTLQHEDAGERSLGIITSGISYLHVREAVPDAKVLKLGLTWPLPERLVRDFAASVDRCLVVEEGDPWLAERLLMLGLPVETKLAPYRFGELSVERVRRIVARDETAEPVPPRGKPPQLCDGCPHRKAFEVFGKLDLIVAGDIGCYTLGVLPPFQAMDTMIAMGAAIGVGLGLRHSLPPDQAWRVVSVIGDSTFVHSGLTGLVEMVYNPPESGHVLVILDNGTTAMTGLQEHPATGRRLNHDRTGRLSLEGLCRAAGVDSVQVVDAIAEPASLETALTGALEQGGLHVIICRRPCLLAAKRIRELDRLELVEPAAECSDAK